MREKDLVRLGLDKVKSISKTVMAKDVAMINVLHCELLNLHVIIKYHIKLVIKDVTESNSISYLDLTPLN